ncbi:MULTISPECIES: DUF4177 domain-containing protein [Paenibacillus]|uniref:DUF4177 domain-containing protein n=1 Tax=Paenibacillus TaxID=44249 RepID=UPI0022B9232F|nr:DUF4177 domain-containing protein [Paenibacillus caseinilyticus]MCZ8522287.1 DUF4177 domain-containing protein [Paenibacillus caseinilyticus]
MYEYKFVEVTIGGFFSEATYRETLEAYARDGWRLVQIFQSSYNGHGKPTKHELILERPITS